MVVVLSEHADLVQSIASQVVKVPGLKSFRITPRLCTPKCLAVYIVRTNEPEEDSIAFPLYLNFALSQTIDFMVETALREKWGPLLNDPIDTEESEDDEDGEEDTDPD